MRWTRHENTADVSGADSMPDIADGVGQSAFMLLTVGADVELTQALESEYCHFSHPPPLEME
jgi:hypothetical protein